MIMDCPLCHFFYYAYLVCASSEHRVMCYMYAKLCVYAFICVAYATVCTTCARDKSPCADNKAKLN